MKRRKTIRAGRLVWDITYTVPRPNANTAQRKRIREVTEEQIQRTNANTDQRCAVSGQMLIEGAGELRFHFVGGDALGVEHPVFQGDVSNL